MKFNTKYDFFEKDDYLTDDTLLVESAGYVPREKTIENLLLCGQRLIESRMNEYDGKTIEEALENADVTRCSDFDVVDAGVLLRRVQDSSGENQIRTNVGNPNELLKKTSEVEKTSEVTN